MGAPDARNKDPEESMLVLSLLKTTRIDTSSHATAGLKVCVPTGELIGVVLCDVGQGACFFEKGYVPHHGYPV